MGFIEGIVNDKDDPHECRYPSSIMALLTGFKDNENSVRRMNAIRANVETKLRHLLSQSHGPKR